MMPGADTVKTEIASLLSPDGKELNLQYYKSWKRFQEAAKSIPETVEKVYLPTEIHKTTSTPQLITDLLTFLQNSDNGNLDKDSLRPMLLDSLHKKFETSGYDYLEGESRCDFGSRLKVIARLCNCPELITTDKLNNSLLDKLASCSFG